MNFSRLSEVASPRADEVSAIGRARSARAAAMATHKMNAPANSPARDISAMKPKGYFRSPLTLVQVVADLGEGVLEVGAERGDGGNDRNRDQRGDQAVFDGGRAGLVSEEALERLDHRVCSVLQFSHSG